MIMGSRNLRYRHIGMLFGLATHRRIHAAWFWGFGVLVAMAVTIGLVASVPPFASFAASIVE